MVTTASSVAREAASTAISGEFCQMELPLHRERDVHHGSYFRNCRFVDAVRRSIMKRLPHGAAIQVATIRSKVAKLRAEAQRADEEFDRQERRASAELQAIRTRNAIDSSERILARFSIEAPKVQAYDPFAGEAR
jgi:hypothetical protein